MVIFTKLKWRSDRVAHILSKHGITPGEVEEVCFGKPLILRGPGKKGNRLYYVLGQTEAGRHLFIVLKPVAKGIALPVTARLMTSAQQKKYKRR